MNSRAFSLTLAALIAFNPLLAAAAAIERDAPNTVAIEPILPLQESVSAEMPTGIVFENTEDPSISINEDLPASVNSLPIQIEPTLNSPQKNIPIIQPKSLEFIPRKIKSDNSASPFQSQTVFGPSKISQGLINLKKNALKTPDLSAFYDGDNAGKKSGGFFSKIFKRSSSQPKTDSNEELAKTIQEVPPDPVQNNVADVDGDSLNQFLARQNVPEAERPAVRKTIDRLWHILSGAGIAIGGENVEFRIGEWWQTDLENNVVYLPLEEIIKNRNNPDALVGGVVHEGGHVDRTRWHKLPGYKEFLEDSGFPQATHTLMNVLEDLFEEHAVSKRWPGAEHYLKELHHAYRPDLYGGDLALPGNAGGGKNSPDEVRKIKEMFPHEEYIEALRSFWMTRSFPDPTSFVNPEVKEAVALTEKAVKKLLDLVPEKIAPNEDEKIKNNYERMEHIKNEIWPQYQKLLQLSQERASQAQNSQQGEQNGQQKGQQSSQQGQQSGQSQGQGQPGQQQGQQSGQGSGQQGSQQRKPSQQNGQQGGQDIQSSEENHSESEQTNQEKKDGQESGEKSDKDASAENSKDSQSGQSDARDNQEKKDSTSSADKSEVERKIKEMIESRAHAIEKQLSPTHGEGKENKENTQHDHHSKNEKQDSVSLNPKERAQESSSEENGQKSSETEKQGEKERKDNTAPPGSTAKPDNQGDLGVQEILKRLLESHESVAEASRPRDSYQENLLKTSYVIDALTGRLENIFMKNARMSWEDRSYQSGAKVNIKKWMISEANGWKNDSDFKVFQRRKMPTRRDYQFTLLVDLSGSMGGANMDYAQQLMIVFMETLERLGIDYSLMGFSEDVYMFKDFVGDISQIKPLSMPEKEALLQTVRASGGGSTYDTEAIYAAIRGNPDKDVSGLEDQAGERRALIVVTDGEGNGGASGQMGAALAEAAQKGITVIGVGVGAGMSYVAKRYPKYVVEPSMETVPEKIGDIIEDEIQNGFEQDNSEENRP